MNVVFVLCINCEDFSFRSCPFRDWTLQRDSLCERTLMPRMEVQVSCLRLLTKSKLHFLFISRLYFLQIAAETFLCNLIVLTMRNELLGWVF
jgi:hypothetical protein